MHAITIIRDYLGLTQQGLAKQAGITQADLCEMENREPYGSIVKYQRVSKVLDIPVHVLVTNDLTKVPLSFFELHDHIPYVSPAAGKKAQIGRDGEEEALFLEQQRLSKICPALSRLVIPYFKLRTNSPGYDLLSYNECGKPVLIEVKTTCHGPSTDFNLTRHEYEVAVRQTKKGIPYRIYRFSNWGSPDQQLDVLDFATMQAGQIRPSEYICSMRPKDLELSGIAHHRQRRGLSQQDLAQQLNILPNHLCRYEKGERSCPVTLYRKLSELLEVPIDDLLASYPVTIHEQ